MLIHPEKPLVALHLRNPQTVLNTIPTARLKHHNGRDFVVVPHRIDETTILNRLGVPVPSPILTRYQWTGRYTPFVHQKTTAAFLTLHRRAFCFNEMGSGKTLSALHAAEFLMRQGKIRKALVVCPLSTMQRAWGDEIFQNLMHRKYAILHGSRERRLKLLAQEDIDYYIVNHDGISLPWLQGALLERGDINLIIADEASAYRNHRTLRYKKFAQLIARPNIWSWLLTATPCPNAPTDAWALARLVDGTKVPKFFKAFQERVMHQVTTYKWVPKPDGAEVAFNCMQPAIRFRTRDCIDLPPTTFQTREAAMSDEQAKAYAQMHRTFTMEAAGERTVVAANAAVKLSKLVQIACGIVRTGEGDETVELDCARRVAVVREVIEEAGGKTIVFVPFKSVLRRLAENLAEDYSVAVVSGDTALSERNDTFYKFQNAPDPQVLVAHPKCMSHGLTLTAADTIIWYAPYPSNEVTEQANGRIVRPGQTRHTNIVEIESSSVEREMYHALRNKKKMASAIMDMYKNEFGVKNRGCTP